MESALKRTSHIWNFARIGGNDRVRIETGRDIAALDELDQKLWTALSCPVDGLEFDKKTLALLDGNADGKIRAPEIIAAVKWITSIIKTPDDLVKSESALPLSAIDTRTPLGTQILESAKEILKNLGKPNSEFISTDDTSDTVKIFANTKFNGDGVIPPEAADDADLKHILEQILKTVGSVEDRSGKPGVNKEAVEKFYATCADFCAWTEVSLQNSAKISPFGAETENAFAAMTAVKSKIEDFFLRCRFAEFDSRSTDVLNSQISDFMQLTGKDLTTCMNELSAFPLAHINTKKELPLTKELNPAWQQAVLNFKELVVNPIFGKNQDNLNETEWQKICAIFEPYAAWKTDKKGDAVEVLGYAEAKRIVSENRKAEIIALIDHDLTFADEADSIISVDKLVRYYTNLYKLITNYVSFIDFYTPDKMAIFQIGTLYIDQRSCDFCLKVVDSAKHAAMAHLSGMYLLYCDCVSKVGGQKMSIVAGITNGDTDNLMVGRNGLFYDRNGNDWDATVVKVIENPISIRQAFFSPYKKFIRMIEEQIQKFAANREKSVEDSATANIEKSATKLTAAPVQTDPAAVPETDPKAVAPKQQFDIAKYMGIFAAIGLAIGAIGSMLAAIFTGFLSLAWWQMPLAVLSVILLISGPSMILAWMKLRKRNLAPILDANGWAVNAKSLINMRFGATLTSVARLPKNSKRVMNDPFSKKRIPTWVYFAVLVILAGGAYALWHFGYWAVIKTWFV